MSKNTSFRCAKTRSIDSQTSRLLQIVGAKRFEALQHAFGGQRVWIPKGGARIPCAVCSTRDACISEWRKEGLSVAEISRHLGISIKTAYRVLGGKI